MATIAETPDEANQYEKLRKPIQDIIKFTNTVDERYREKCFEVLLNQYLLNNTEMTVYSPMQENKKTASQAQDYPIELRIFLEENKITEETINKLFIREKGVVRPIYKISEKRKAVAQILIALLTAFENALATPNAAFEFSIKTVRQRCMDCNVYETDFILNFKNRAGLFHNVDTEDVKLTPTGKAELANVIAYISKQ
jgi:hypothetical protein